MVDLRERLGGVAAVPAEAVERLKNAIEGECHGLAIDDDQAAAILGYVAMGDAYFDDAPGPAHVEAAPATAGPEELEIQRLLLHLHSQLAFYSDENTPRALAAFLERQSAIAAEVLKMLQARFFPATPPARSYAKAVEDCARWVAKRRDDYIEERGYCDPETNTMEFPGNGEEYVGELDEIEEGLRSLLRSENEVPAAPPARSYADGWAECREAAAKVAEGWECEASDNVYMTSGNGNFWDPGTNYDQARSDAAAAIRSLAPKEG